MSVPLDRKFFPTKLGARPTAKGVARYFNLFVPDTGPFSPVRLAEGIRAGTIARLRDDVAHSGWRVKVQKAAHIVIDRMARDGLRFELKCEDLANLLGLTKSMGSYYFKRLREVGFLDLYRKHYIDWKRTNEIRDLKDDDALFIARPTVHELNKRRSEALLRSDPPDIYQGFVAEKYALTCKNSENPQVRA